MEKHFELTDDDFESQFDQCVMEPGIFSHEAHLRLSWIHIRKYGCKQAIINICRQIRAFDRKNGDGTKFEKEMTIDAVKWIHHVLAGSGSSTFREFLRSNPGLITDFRQMMADFKANIDHSISSTHI